MPISVMDVLSDPAPWLGRQIVVRGDIVGIRPSILVARAEKVAYTCWQDVVSPEEGLHLQFPGRCIPCFTIGGLPIARCAVVTGMFTRSMVGLTQYMIADVSEITIGGPLSEFPDHPVTRVTRDQASRWIDGALQRCIKLGQSAEQRVAAEARVRDDYSW